MINFANLHHIDADELLGFVIEDLVSPKTIKLCATVLAIPFPHPQREIPRTNASRPGAQHGTQM
jgi:hypothetical protein